MERLINLITSIVTLLGVTISIVVSLMNRKKIEDVHISIDGRMDQLLQSHGKEMKAEGVAQERDRDKGNGK